VNKANAKFRTFPGRPKRSGKRRAETVIYSRRKVVSQQYKEIKEKYHQYKRNYSQTPVNRTSKLRLGNKLSSLGRTNRISNSYHKTSSQKVNKVYRNAKNHKKLKTILKNIEEKEMERKFQR
jgi:hypothetical protein